MPSPSQVQATLTSNSNRCCSCTPSPIVYLLLTLLMTSSASMLLCASIMTDHWEHVTWDTSSLANLANASGQTLHWLLNGRVARLPIEGQVNRGGIFFVPMNGGIWTLCIDLDDDDLRQLGRWGFPRTSKCINYLAGNHTEMDPQVQLEEPRAIWQHSEFQTPLHPHLSRYNNIVKMLANSCKPNSNYYRMRQTIKLTFVANPDSFDTSNQETLL